MSDGSGAPLSLTKIIATLGPASDSPEIMRRLVECGVNVFRLNFSHGDERDHARRLQRIRQISDEIGRPVAVLGDLPGPKIRVGQVPGYGIEVKAGDEIAFRSDLQTARTGTPPVFPCTYDRLVEEVEPGHRVLLADGVIRALAVERVSADDGAVELRCHVTAGGTISTGKGVNLPDSDISVPAITERDWRWVDWAFEHGVDYLALSFVRRAAEIRELKTRLTELSADIIKPGESREPHIPIVAKIEKPQAVRNIDEIVAEADAIMVARGDLGVEMDLAYVPVTQKKLIAAAHLQGRPVIVATQMLETMIETSTPTRAEVSDVANAIFDEADAVMLSGETAIGKYPSLAVETMRRIAVATESRLRELSEGSQPPQRLVAQRSPLAALALGAWHVAQTADASVAVCWSQSGGTARHLSQMGFRIPIVAFSSDPLAVRRMCLLYGVVPVIETNPPLHRSDFGMMIEKLLLERGWGKRGEMYVALAGKPFGTPGVVNTLALRRLGNLSTAPA
ncbi:MAG: pyruvate kinase [Phycisphaerales bacterium]